MLTEDTFLWIRVLFAVIPLLVAVYIVLDQKVDSLIGAAKWIVVGLLVLFSFLLITLHTPAYYLTADTATIVVEDKYFVDTCNPPRYVRSEYPGLYYRWGGMRVDEQYIEWVYGQPTYHVTTTGGREYVIDFDMFRCETPRQRYKSLEIGQSYRIKSYGWFSEMFGTYPNIVWIFENSTES